MDRTVDAALNAQKKSHGFRGVPPKQWLKLVVYSLLFVNFLVYFTNDFVRMIHTVNSSWTWFDWTSAFATTLDEAAWFLLLILFELETYVLADDAFTARRIRIMQLLRLLCVLVIGHTIFAFGDYLHKLETDRVHHTDIDLCSLAGQELSYTNNLEYWDLTAETCESLATGREYFQFDKKELVTDPTGWNTEWGLAWSDFIEVVVWLLILGLTELMVRLQDRGVTRGRLMGSIRVGKAIFYGALWLIAGYWLTLGHYIFAWDEALWILGFMIIGMNLSAWRDEIEANDVDAAHGIAKSTN